MCSAGEQLTIEETLVAPSSVLNLEPPGFNCGVGVANTLTEANISIFVNFKTFQEFCQTWISVLWEKLTDLLVMLIMLDLLAASWLSMPLGSLRESSRVLSSLERLCCTLS